MPPSGVCPAWCTRRKEDWAKTCKWASCRGCVQQCWSVNNIANGRDNKNPATPSSGLRPYFFAIAALVRNEAKWLPEWLSYHSLPTIGCQHFYLYDDASSDELEASVEPYVHRGLVTIYRNFTQDLSSILRNDDLEGLFFPAQKAMVTHVSLHHHQSAHWIAFVDVDEFIFLGAAAASTAALLSRLPEDVGGLVMRGDVIHGASEPSQLVMMQATAQERRDLSPRPEVAV